MRVSHSLKGALAIVSTTLFLQQPLSEAATLASSTNEFSGIQGSNSWFYGYRNYTSDGGGVPYDPDAGFIPFAGGEGQGDWDGVGQMWNGTRWDLNTASAAPWTEVQAEFIHPNGSNNAEEHWVIRRWVADELTGTTNLAIRWNTRKNASGGTGVTGALYVNGKQISVAALAGTNTVGVTRTNYLPIAKGDKIDLILSPVGNTADRADGSDGSRHWMVIETAADTDTDGLPDGWEILYAGDLVKLSATSDFDGDGRTEPQEFAGNLNPARSDTDGDGVSDGAEIAGSTDPLDPNSYASTTNIAASDVDFSGVQGQNNWYSGFRTGAGAIADYPTNQVVLFSGGSNLVDDQGVTRPWANQAPWTTPGPDIQMWNGGGWDMNTAAAAPWTELGRTATHPNTGGGVHWTVRRWQASALTNVTPLTLRYHVRKSNVGGGNGVTGGLYQNGKLLDSVVIQGRDGIGTTRAVYANVAPNDYIDLILSPRGSDNADNDGQDGTNNRLEIDTTLTPNPRQPNDSVFVPAGAADTDGDGIPDAWERLYAPNLTTLTRTGDVDNDGLSDLAEYTRDSDPTKADTDADGLPDRVETGTGTYLSATDTGSSPRNADTDGDGLSDSAEVNGTPRTDPTKGDTDGDGFNDREEILAGTNPNVPQKIIANSQTEFSGIQGQNGWWNGYRNYTLDGETTDYQTNSANSFIMYAGGAGQGAWDGSTQLWTGGGWALETAATGPWTSQSASDTHPNGANSTPGEEHWTIRRWAATELTNVTPVAIIWQVRKVNGSGDGVTGSLHINGKQVDTITIAGNNVTNPVRRVYANLKPTDLVDLALTPQGLTTRSDGADGSATLFSIDTVLPDVPRQPDGALFIPANAPDTDNDGLPDFWERSYGADLTTFTGTGDNDADTLNNAGELQRDTDPTKADTDGDGLSDAAETKTGTFVSATNTGSNPRKVDTDGDGVPDGPEVTLGLNPNDAASNARIGDSRAEFSDGVQGENGWRYGYRNYTTDGATDNYNPTTAFIPFTEDLWTGTIWDLNPAATGPWTELGRETSHPNGTNSDPNEEHWTIRRWSASELTQERPLALRWSVRKSNTGGGNGVTGGIYINGVLTDSAAVAGTDGIGVTRTYYAMVKPTDVIDLINSPVGPDAGRADGADGSALWLEVSTYVPADAKQPDGTPFVPGGRPQIRTINVSGGQVTLTWSSQAGVNYTIAASSNLTSWTNLKTAHPSGGATTSYTDTSSPLPPFRFYRIQQQ
jgi:hypothetical protein